MLEVLIAMAMSSDPNAITKYCVEKIEGQNVAYVQTADWNKIAGCASDLRQAQRKIDYKELRDFLEQNPHYRYPGTALPAGRQKALDKCWGKTRKYHKDGMC